MLIPLRNVYRRASTFTRFFAKDPGTYWWHSHAGLQRSDGLFGHLVIRQPPSRDPHSALYDYDLPEHVMSVTDWLVEMTANRFASHHNDDGDNKPASMLINGELLGGFGGVVNSLDFCPASLKSLGCFYFRCVLSSQWKAVATSEPANFTLPTLKAFLEARSQNVSGNKQ